jgi:hypothetical protein
MPTSSYYHNTKPREGSPNKRWQTTTRSALEDVANQLKGSYDRAAMVEGLKDRKISNTKTSISFGNDKVFLFLSLHMIAFQYLHIFIITPDRLHTFRTQWKTN